MFQCIIQQRNGWIHAPTPEMRDVFPDIRLQLNEQLKSLDVRVESQVSLVQELQDFFRRRSEVEMDYSKSLDKLAKSLQLRHKEQKQKREQWPLFSSYSCWQQLINHTRSLSKDHAALSEIYSIHLVARLQTVIEDLQRIYKKCREIGYEVHEEILRVLQELHTTMKTYHNYQTDCKAAESKLRTADIQRMKLQQTIPKEKLERNKKYRLIEKEVLKRKNKYTDARLKALKARNEYQLCLEASNTTIHKYFVEDLSDLIDCMDLGFGSMVSRAVLMHVTADQGRSRAILQNADNLSHTLNTMDSRADKQKFLEQHHAAFMIPKRLEFQGDEENDTLDPELQKALYSEMEQRLGLLEQRVSNLRAESEEIWKTLETAEVNLLEFLNIKDYDTSDLFGDGTQAPTKSKLDTTATKSKGDKQEIEEFYVSKIREYILCTSKIARLDSKADFTRNILTKNSALTSGLLIKSILLKRKRIGRINMSGQPKLFGGSLEEYLEATNEQIPLIIRSCVRIINLYGLHHQGIFRISGSQIEITNFREAFERGDDPLADITDASDINSVAGVLKLYLRELREPLFPIIYFDHFVSLAQLESKHEMVIGIKKFLQSLPRAVIIVIQYLFAFLNHLSEYSDENMMDAYNLAICFGPTLMPAPEDKDQVQYQNQVNELIKNMIVYHAELFPKDLGGLQYEKYIIEEPFIDTDVGDSPTEQVIEDPDSEVYPSEDESDILEAAVQFDFNARSDRELSLRKGDSVILRKQVSNDWWQGTVNGRDGLVPDKYISLKIKGEDRDRDHLKSSSSEESVRKRRLTCNPTVSCEKKYERPSQSYQQHKNLSILHSTESLSNDHLINIVQKKSLLGQQEIALSQQIQSNELIQQQDPSLHQLLSEKIESLVINKTANEMDNSILESSNKTHQKYGYHGEQESSLDSLDGSIQCSLEEKKESNLEPIYAEPNKITIKTQMTEQVDNGRNQINEENDGVRLRNKQDITIRAAFSCEKNIGAEPLIATKHCDESTFSRRSDPNEDNSHFSLSSNYNSAGENQNLFKQNRELWEKRSSDFTSQDNIAQPRILERKRGAPDLVMDLPISDTSIVLRNSRDSLDFENSTADELTSGERFALQSQSTLKKNERFLNTNEAILERAATSLELKVSREQDSDSISQCSQKEILKSESSVAGKKAILEEILHIDEEKNSSTMNPISKSPIPRRNTQKFVSQFSDLKLTGGCLSQTEKNLQQQASSSSSSSSSSSAKDSGAKDQTPLMTSFKPQIKIKPQIIKKSFSKSPATPEMEKKNKE